MPGITSLANESMPHEAKSLTVGNIVVDLDGFRIFVRQPDSVILYGDLERALWGSVGERNRLRLGVLLCRLRAKLAASHPYRFETVRGRGYGLLTLRRDAAEVE